jgi:predicted  nucleic acid-binding Zn-ribbon protein
MMNRRMLKLLALSVALLALLIGCGAKEDTATTDATETTETAAETTEEVAETVAEGFEAVKTEYVAAVKTTVDEWNTKIADIEAKMTALPELAQKPLTEPVQNLKDKGVALAAQIVGLETATEETFEDEKIAIDESVAGVQSAYDAVMTLF